MDLTCSVTNFLANGIPDYQLNGGWSRFIITGSTTTSINQQNTQSGNNYLVGTYSHSTNGVSYYLNGDDVYCKRVRNAKITWKCGDRHMELTGMSEPNQCEYHLEIEINCCQGM